MDPITIGATAVMGLGNLFSNSSANAQRSGALAKYRKKLIEAQYDPVETAKAIDRVGDTFNTEMANAMNSSAFGLGRFLNSNTAKAVSMSKMLGQRSGAMVQEASRIDEYNKRIDLQIAESELNEPITDPLGDLLTGGMAGMQLGMSMENLSGELEWNDVLKKFVRGSRAESGSGTGSGKRVNSTGQVSSRRRSSPGGA